MKKSFFKRGSIKGLIVGLILTLLNILLKGRLGYAILSPFFILLGKGCPVCTGQLCWIVDVMIGMVLGSVVILIISILIGYLIGKCSKNIR